MTEARLAGLLLLIVYTVAAVLVLPFAVVLMLYAPMLVGSENRPDGPLVVPVMLALLGLPVLLLVGPIGAWIAWGRRRSRQVWVYAGLPVVYGVLVIVALSVFVG